MKLEKKIYPNWAFKENMEIMRDINREIYKELIQKYKINEGEDSDIIWQCSHEYCHNIYYIKKYPNDINIDELALLCDDGNLCFGYKGNIQCITIFTD